MSIPTVLPPQASSSSGRTLSAHPLKWREYRFEDITLQGSITSGVVKNKQLKGTLLSCTIATEAGEWKNRQIFIEKVLENILSHCPKDEPLALISLGSDRLLIEYILGKSLFENGFRQLSFMLIDPIYALSNPNELKITLAVLADFRKQIEKVYFDCYKEPFAKERIRFLSRGQNVVKCFPSHANVVLLESLPPYAEHLKDIAKQRAEEKKTEDLLAGGWIVKPEHANALALIPKQYGDLLLQSGATLTHALPLAILRSNSSRFYVDWGCKIEANGSYHLSFSGEALYFASLGLLPDQQMKVAKDEVVRVKEWIPTMKKCIEDLLQKEIKQIKLDEVNLSQEQISSLLIKVQEVALLYMPNIQSYFTADYALDRAEVLVAIKSQASPHYRRAFTLSADVATTYKVTIDEI